MTLYEKLDWVADAFIPVYLLLFILLIGQSLAGEGKRAGVLKAMELLVALGVIYGLYLLDAALGLWPRIQLDYSTHTAFSLCLVALLSFSRPKAGWALLASFFGYLILMWFQRYHSVLDMLTTAMVVFPLLLFARIGLYRWAAKEGAGGGL